MSRHRDNREIVAWLRRTRAAIDPTLVVIRGVDGRVVVELPRNGREGSITTERAWADMQRERERERPQT